ncbi:MAG: hypothetical protein KC502_13020 [Myxococcales bacterium]|nr:hypothetical protein [Myxococcales bacterium]
MLQRLALDSTALPDAPNPGQWMAGGLQCALTDAIAMQFYDGDLQRLEAPLLEDAQRGVGRMSRLIVRGLGPARLLSKASDLHAQTWDLGEVSVTLKEHSAVINVSGSPLFTYRTWLALQLMALKGTVSLTGLSVETLYASRIASDRAQLTVAWC